VKFETLTAVTHLLITKFILNLNLPTTTIVAQPFNVIKWQLKFNPVGLKVAGLCGLCNVNTRMFLQLEISSRGGGGGGGGGSSSSSSGIKN
jgi:hypothetical protein